MGRAAETVGSDELWHTVVGVHGNDLPDLFDSLFSFLRRRTDFYHELGPSDVGLPKGQARAIVEHAFEHQAKLHRQYNAVRYTNIDVDKNDDSKASVKSLEVESNKKTREAVEVKVVKSGEGGSVQGAPFPTSNGGQGDHYYWDQTESNICLMFPLTNPRVEKREITVSITPQELTIMAPIRADAPFRRRWLHTSVPDCSSWYLTWQRCVDADNRYLIVEVDKRDKLWWGQPFVELDSCQEVLTKFKPIPKRLEELDSSLKHAIGQEIRQYDASRT